MSHSAACYRGKDPRCPACHAVEPTRCAGYVAPVWPLHLGGPPRVVRPGPLSPGMVRRVGARLDGLGMGDLAALAERIRESGWDAEQHVAPDTDPQRARWRTADPYTRRKLAIEDDITGSTT